MKLSVIICCYNSQSRLPNTLDHILKCRIATGTVVEVILVDNCCTDNTVSLANSIWGNSEIVLKTVSEKRPGLNLARQKGIQAASGEILIFVDDDNWLGAHYFEQLESIFENMPTVGIIGGLGTATADTPLPSWFTTYQKYYATNHVSCQSSMLNTVAGAGMAVRVRVLEDIKAAGFESQLVDRNGTELSSGGDSELCYQARLLNWSVYFCAELQFEHYLPRERLTDEYLKRLLFGVCMSSATIDVYRYLSRHNSANVVYFKCLSKMSRRALKLFFSKFKTNTYSENEMIILLAHYESWQAIKFVDLWRRIKKIQHILKTFHS